MVEVVILGAGISGLATAYYLQEQGDESINIKVIEKEKQIGGKIHSIKDKGYLCEAGPAAFLDNKPDTIKLVQKLGLKTLKSNESAKKRYIFTGGKLRKVPEGPKEFLRSDILSIPGKLRVMAEIFTKESQVNDESIANFGKRHLGSEAQEKLISPMVIGIHAGDSEKLSLKSCFPIMKDLEKAGNGSLFKAMLRRIKKAKKEGKANASATGNLTSFIDGMETLTKSLLQSFGGEMITGKEVESISSVSKGFKVILSGGEKIDADVLISALPAYSAAKILGSFDKNLSSILSKIPYAPASVVCLGYNSKELSSTPDGFGFLVPKKEGSKILGCRWDSSTFMGRASDDRVLLWTIVGGSIRPDLAHLDDDSILETVQGELKVTMGIKAKPEFIKIFRHKKAIPQYVLGHEKTLQEIKRIIKKYPGLYLTGNAFKGIGINDCIKNASILADEVADFINRI